jgi:hypothetical protein
MRWYYALAFVLALQMVMVITASEFRSTVSGNYTLSPSSEKYYSTYMGSNYTLIGNMNQFLPTAQGSVDPNTGALYTDEYLTGKSWLTNTNVNFISAPKVLFVELGIPPYIAGPLAVFWYLFIGALVLYQFLRGGA